jgi:ankyrin repeat protein
MAKDMDVKTAIQSGDAEVLRRLLEEDKSRANALVRWGKNDCILTHPLHYVSDMLFWGTLKKGKELPLIEALIAAGADVDFQREHEDGKQSDTPLIGAASLAVEEVGLRLLDAGARPELRGLFGETALHWAAFIGEYRLAERLIQGSDVNLKDQKYRSSPLGWAVHGRYNPPAGNQGKQCEVAALLVSAGASILPEWLESAEVRADAALLAALQTANPDAA